MLKKIAFILLVFAFIIAGALVSMANEGEDFTLSNITVNNVTSDFHAVNEPYQEQKEEYSHELVIEMYSSLFFDVDNKTDTEFIIEEHIVIEEDSSTKEDIQDYYFSATPSKDVQLEKGNTIVVMVFVQKGDTFELLCDPAECNTGFLERIRIHLPNVGSDNPNNIRVIAFPKNSYKELSLDNIQIYDTKIIIFDYDFMGTIKTMQGILDSYDIIPK